MRTILNNLALLLFLLPCLALAGNGVPGGKYTKEKKIAKAYIVNDNCALDINNKFGSVYVTTWDEDKTQIEVVIKVSGNNEEKVDKRLSTIDIEFEPTKSIVKAFTRIGNMSGNNLSMEINYTIKIPKKGSIDLNNQYGAIITGKIYGRARIDCQYGDVNIDELNSDSNSIVLQYSGTSKINYMKSGEVNVQYSGFNITRVGNLKLSSQYTGVNVGEVQNIEYRTEYGDVNVKKAGNATGSGAYSALKFGDVNGNFNATCEYGEVRINNLSSGVKNVAINAAYTNIAVNFQEGYAFDFEFHTEYGNLRGATGLKFTEKREKDNSNHYKGYYRSSGTNRMYIKSEYGDINLGRS